MIRRSTGLSLAVALAIGAGLFQLKHEVQLLEERLAEVNRSILADQEAVHVLEAEWTYLNRPWRLEALAKRHLELAPLAAAQVVTFDQLPSRVEPVISDATNPTAAGGANHKEETAVLPNGAPVPEPAPKPEPGYAREPASAPAPALPAPRVAPAPTRPARVPSPSLAEIME
jgi:hypothetical protein